MALERECTALFCHLRVLTERVSGNPPPRGEQLLSDDINVGHLCVSDLVPHGTVPACLKLSAHVRTTPLQFNLNYSCFRPSLIIMFMWPTKSYS